MTNPSEADALKASITADVDSLTLDYGLSDPEELGQIMLRHHVSAARIGDEVIDDGNKTNCVTALYSIINRAAHELLNLDPQQHLTVRIAHADDRAKLSKVLDGVFELATTGVRKFPLSTNDMVVADLIHDLCEYCLDGSGEEVPDLGSLTVDDFTQDGAYKHGMRIFPFIRRVIASCGWFIDNRWFAIQMQIQTARLRQLNPYQDIEAF